MKFKILEGSMVYPPGNHKPHQPIQLPKPLSSWSQYIELSSNPDNTKATNKQLSLQIVDKS